MGSFLSEGFGVSSAVADAVMNSNEEQAVKRESSHFVELPENRRLMIFSGRSHPDLSFRIAGLLNLEPGGMELATFANGEIYCRFSESIRGADVFIIQTCSPPINEHIMELLIIVDALKRASARKISAVIPYFGYSRQDKKTLAREPVSAKLMADLLSVAGTGRVLTMDLHAGQIQGFFNHPLDHLTAVPVISDYIDAFMKANGSEDYMIISPDAGRVKMAKKYAEHLNASMAILYKRRTAKNVAEITDIIGDVKGKSCVLIDDMIDTAGTMVEASKALINKGGAKDIYAAATHGIFSPPARERLDNSDIEKVIVTNTLPRSERWPERIDIIDVAEAFAGVIKNVFTDKSVSGLFKGKNMP